MKKVDQKTFYKLVGLVKENYITRDEGDSKFAAWASLQLGTEVSPSTVSTARDVLEIPSWQERQRATAVFSGEAVTELREWVERLANRLRAQEDANGTMHNRIHSLEGEVRRLKEVVKDMTYQLDKVADPHRQHSGQG